MSTRPDGKKSLQTFHARTSLWKLFEKRAQEMDCSVDYLVNEAMRLYASTYGLIEIGPDAERSSVDLLPGESMPPPLPLKATVSSAPRNVEAASSRPRAPMPPAPGAAPSPSLPSGRTPSPQRPTAFGNTMPIPTMPNAPPRPPLPRPSSDDSGIMPTQPPRLPLAPAPAKGQLVLIFQGRKIVITGDQFIIGRGTKSSDLPIKDANISRKHAAVILHNGTYYLKDLGSTNGIEFAGKSIDSKRIDEGDVFHVCGYELHFTYNP